jgi:hypothetical protein
MALAVNALWPAFTVNMSAAVNNPFFISIVAFDFYQTASALQ